LQYAAIGGDPLIDLGGANEEGLVLFDGEFEEPGAILVADAEDVGESTSGDEGGFGAAASEQGVGASSGAEADGAGWDGLVEQEIKKEPDGQKRSFLRRLELVRLTSLDGRWKRRLQNESTIGRFNEGFEKRCAAAVEKTKCVAGPKVVGERPKLLVNDNSRIRVLSNLSLGDGGAEHFSPQ